MAGLGQAHFQSYLWSNNINETSDLRQMFMRLWLSKFIDHQDEVQQLWRTILKKDANWFARLLLKLGEMM